MAKIPDNNENNLKIQTWKRMEFVLYAGIIMVFLIGLHDPHDKLANLVTILSRFGIGLLIGGASMSAGGFLGFIFGIPSLLQNPALNTGRATTLKYNDNLVQISDWLTKIIVGVGLTQLNSIPASVMSMGTYLSHNFGADKWGRNASLAIVFYFLLFGFLMIYFWTRTDFTTIMKDTDDELVGEFEKMNQKIEDNKQEQENKLRLSDLTNKIERFETLKDRIINSENNFDGLKDIFKIIKPGPIKWLDDPQKGRWGGSAEVNGLKLDAAFSPSSDTFEERKIYTVTLSVSGSPDHPLAGKVYFFLHQSYMPNHIITTEALNNIASVQIESYEAFTVGAVCEQAATMLELDMNEYAGTPDDYKYRDKLELIDDLKEQKALLIRDTSTE